MKRRLSAGEIRFRVSAKDVQRLNRLVKAQETTISQLLRNLITEECVRHDNDLHLRRLQRKVNDNE